MSSKVMLAITAILVTFATFNAKALDKLTATDLKTLCQNMSVGKEYYASDKQCLRYIKGFVDGIVMANKFKSDIKINERKQRSAFSERAINTRVQSRIDNAPKTHQSQQLCIDDDKELKKVVNTIAKHVVDQQQISDNSQARYLVYDSLLTHFRCG